MISERFGFGQLATMDEKVLKYIHEEILTDTVIRHLRHFETLLASNNNNADSISGGPSAWIANTPVPSIADFTLVPRLKDLQAHVKSEMDFDILLIFPQLSNLVDRFYGLPKVNCYYQGNCESESDTTADATSCA